MNEQEKKPSNPTIKEGWTLRDEFANSAMQSILINMNNNVKNGYTSPIYAQFRLMSVDAYSIADAMLKQREL